MLSMYGREATELAASDHGCRFCDAAARETLISETEHATAFPSLGALVEGWTLIAPREHVVATSELADDRWRDLVHHASQIATSVGAAYGPTVTFEHGATGTNRTAGCGVDHAHLHVVPWTGDVRKQIASVPNLPAFKWLPGGDRPTTRPGEDYIWLADRTGTWITHASELPSQVVRQAISKALGMTWWDWKHDLRLETAEATYIRLSALT